MTIRPAVRTALLVLAAAVVACLAVVGWMKSAPRHVPAGQPPLAQIGAQSLASFRNTFNARAGEIRIVAMLSPT